MIAVLIGLLFVSGGLGIATYSGIVAARAAAGRRMPLWRNIVGYRAPNATQILLLLAGFCVGTGSVFCFLEWGPSGIPMFSLVFIPPFIVAALHNRALRHNA